MPDMPFPALTMPSESFVLHDFKCSAAFLEELFGEDWQDRR